METGCENTEDIRTVVPQGGNTGLVGGSVPVFDEIVINMSRMNEIRSFDEVSGTLVVDAGCILEVVDGYLKEKNHIFPLDLGAKGSCHIGGNVATNAGGLRLLRYGSLHGNVLGIEAVLPDGTVVDDLSKLRKNNTGYDLKQLFIGAEGTIGIITGISVLCPQRSKATNVAFFGLESFEKVQLAFKEAKGQLSEILSAFELMDSQSQDLVHRVTKNKRPLEGEYPFYCLVETSGSNFDHDQEKLSNFLEHVMEKEIVLDGAVSENETQIKAFWSWREGIPECLGHWGGVYKYDLSIPLKELYLLVEETRAKMEKAGLIGDTNEHPVVGVVGYGHMGDSNLHLNVATRRYDKKVEKELEPFVYEWIAKRNGSISAEHGLGLAKKNYIGYSRSDTIIALMKQIKNLYDPNGIMNPYKWFFSEKRIVYAIHGGPMAGRINYQTASYQYIRPGELWQCNWLEETGTIVSLVYDIPNKRITTLLAFSQGHWEHAEAAHGDKRNPADLERWRGLAKIGSKQTDRFLLNEQADILKVFKGKGDLVPIDPEVETL
ncbi:hypothetical protein G7Y89_g4853 [Cudoniella acicularis]|uniref:FAD-binding PCMH-type domain-containing protein n=1 Tax=Cudoniella acicularis TaxID=354080 RepID=A0A8H4RNM4_9HELO|nr:hypothetical protein G7Y89_g4853 [Cudoniella acicularis]